MAGSPATPRERPGAPARLQGMTTVQSVHLSRRPQLVVLLAFLLAAAATLLGAPPAHAAGEDRVTSLDVAYTLRPDGSMHVVEDYAITFAQDRHGITRLVTTLQNVETNPDEHRVYPISNVTASSPSNAPDTLRMTQSGATVSMRIGVANRTVTGPQRYRISYDIGHVVNNQGDLTELSWNVTGNAMDWPIDKTTVTLTGPGPITKGGCAQGEYGSTTPCQATEGPPATFVANNLAAGEGLTIGAAMPTSAFTDTSPQLESGSAEEAAGGDYVSPSEAKARSFGALGVGVGAPLLTLLLLGGLAYTRGRDERYVGLAPDTIPAPGEQVPTRRGGRQPALAVRFNPPEAPPGLVGTVIDERADTIDVSATVIDLAVRGYLRIEQVEGSRQPDWLLTQLRDADATLLDYEQTILHGLFAQGSPILLSQLRTRFASTLAIAKQEMYRETVVRGWFRRSPEAVRRSFSALAALPVIAIFFVFAFGGGISTSTDRIAGVNLPVPTGFVAIGGLALAAVLASQLIRRMPARTAAGSALLQQSRGFREYLLTAEADQIKYDEALNIFQRYLPYAVVYGVADRWAKVFAQVAEQARLEGYDVGMPTFIMFYGGGWGDFGGAGAFGDVIGDFANAASGTFTATPGSSGGSAFGGGDNGSGWGGGGFGGGGFGGFSGGGGGGGGGGSW